jgi:hypothetical protein
MLARMQRKSNSHKPVWEYKLVQPLWRTVWKILKTLKIDPLCTPVVLLLCIYPKEVKSEYKERSVHPCLSQPYP